MTTLEWLAVVVFVSANVGHGAWLWSRTRTERRLRREFAKERNRIYDGIDAELDRLGVERLAGLYREREDG